MSNTTRRFMRLMVLASVMGVEAAIGSTSALARPLAQPPVLLAQRANERIAVLQCGEFTITIRYDGATGSNRYSYQTRGLFLRGGQMDGNDYVFYNSDYEYRVTVNFANQYDTSGNDRLQVLHYGEPIVNKQCTWGN
ncbi:hypothetical protein K9N68_21800 [Kovacikia minuta CCNUW1]|uniref:hypothetical protein n=1 Tax=Kovacikia minuta TaxID=2931930 RepID=UPI001CCCC535|nr:hypothetical protein [Kovacikia minuta]UBF24325.1 hypothetical protein K9N68_21800 [Kovacikia minuta CCNUW1]